LRIAQPRLVPLAAVDSYGIAFYLIHNLGVFNRYVRLFYVCRVNLL